MNIQKKKNRHGKASIEIEKGTEYDSIQLNKILALKLSEDETTFVIDYLIGNYNRTLSDIGVLVNSETLEFISLAKQKDMKVIYGEE